MERHADRAETHPGEQPLVEPDALAHAVHGVDRLAVEQAKVAGAFGQRRAAQLLERRIEGARGPAVEEAVGVAIEALAVDDLEALAPMLDELARSARGDAAGPRP